MSAVSAMAPERPDAPRKRSGDLSTIRRIRARAFARLLPPPKIKLADWIEENVFLPSDVSATPGPMRLFSYQRQICDAIDDPSIERVTFVKPVRIGATALMVAIAANYVKNDPSPILLMQNSADDGRDFMIGTVDSTLNASPALRGLITRDDLKRDTILSRRFPGGWLKCVAAQSPRNLRRHTVRILLMDEIDSYPTDAVEGSPIKLAEKRTLSYSNRLIFSASTPTIAETSNVLKAYADSDQRIFEICCPSCAEWFEPLWEHVKWDKDDAENHLPHTAHMVCPSSGCVIEESAKPAMVEAGRWRATAPHVKGHAGFKTSALISTLQNASWGAIVAEFLASKDDPDLLKVWTNTLLANAWVDRAGDGLDEHALAKRAEPFGLQALPPECLLLTAGVDIGEDHITLVTIGHSATQMFALAYEDIWGAPTSQAVWQELDAHLRRTFKHPFGGQLGYDAAGVDSGSGSHTDIVYSFCRPRLGRRVWATKGVAGVRPLIERSSKQGLMILGVDGGKSRLYGLLDKPGHIRFSADLPTRFYEELASERRITFYKFGQPRKRWERIRGLRAEALDGFVYAMAVRQIVGVNLTDRENVLRQIVQAPKIPAVVYSQWMQRGRER